MDFVEERTPKGVLLKILFTKWQFLAFSRKGGSIYADTDGKSLIHKIPLILFVGKSFFIRKDYDRDYFLLKVRRGVIIVPYTDLQDKKTRYIFIKTEVDLDLIPARIMHVKTIADMVKEIDISFKPDYIVISEEITTNDIIIIKNRYKIEGVIHAGIDNIPKLSEGGEEEEYYRVINLNMKSSNPVYLAGIHLRSMDLSKIIQLLLDFELTALDTEYILNYIKNILSSEGESRTVKKNKIMLENIKDFYQFYLHLLQNNDMEIREMITSQTNVKKMAPFRTLISKVKSLHPGKEEQIQYTEYENIVVDKKTELTGSSKG